MSEVPKSSHPVRTIHKHLFLVRQDAGEVGTLQTTLPFSGIPCAAMSKVFVALPLEFVPAVITSLSVWEETKPRFIRLTYVIRTWLLSSCVDRTPKLVSMQCPWSKMIHKFWSQWQRHHCKITPSDPGQVGKYTSLDWKGTNCNFLN